jgi:hypothetical protein
VSTDPITSSCPHGALNIRLSETRQNHRLGLCPTYWRCSSPCKTQTRQPDQSPILQAALAFWNSEALPHRTAVGQKSELEEALVEHGQIGMFEELYAGCRDSNSSRARWPVLLGSTSKPNTWRDFIACAECLVAKNYTSPAHLAGESVSAGGILIWPGDYRAARPSSARSSTWGFQTRSH